MNHAYASTDGAGVKRKSVPWRSLPALAVLTVIAGLQLALALFSLDVMSAVRAYMTGESLYSKGQKDALIYFAAYAEHQRESDYRALLNALSVPIADRVAREALERGDAEAARVALLQSQTDPSDISVVIRIFQWFGETSLMAPAIQTWREGDDLVEQMRALAQSAREAAAGDRLGAPEVAALKAAGQRINDALTPLQAKFAEQLARGARSTQRILLVLNCGLGLLLWLGGVAFVRNSTRLQVNTEEELARRGESLQGLLDSAAEGLFGIDLQGRCTFINRSALRMLGHTAERDLIGMPVDALVAKGPRGSPGEAGRLPQGAGLFHGAGEVHIAEAWLLRKDATAFPAECWSHPILVSGACQGVVVTFFDITERLAMQAALREQEIRIARLVDVVNEAVIAVDPAGRIVLFNRAAEQLFQVATAQVLGESISRFIPDFVSADALTRGEGPALDLASPVTELVGLRSDGREIALEGSFSGLESEGGVLTTAVLRDASELKTARAERQAREALEASGKAKTEFLSRMSHELRTPLNAVLGFSQMLKHDESRQLSSSHLAWVRNIENAGQHLLALVNDVLDLSRVDAGHMEVNLGPVGVGAAVNDALAMVIPLASSSGVRVSTPTADAGQEVAQVAVMADHVRLRQVLVNLLSNAVKYNRAGGEVRVTWQVIGSQCELCVADQGRGMSKDKLARLFEPFNRLGAENSKIEGTGIGLVLTRRLVLLMEGELRIESIVGSGTRAFLSFPCSREKPVQALGFAKVSQHGELENGLRVLYAEDNEVNAEIVRGALRRRPSVELVVAECGSEAFNVARRWRPQLMLVDMNLGDMTGLELARMLRADPVTAGIRLVALSADAMPEQIDAAVSSGFAGYLTKPVEFRKLLDVVDGK